MWEVLELREGECACDTGLESHEVYIANRLAFFGMDGR